MRLLPCGDTAILAEFDDAAARAAFDGALRAAALPEVLEQVPAARTVLVRARSEDLPRLADALRTLRVDATAASSDARTITVPVVYDGADLDDVAHHLGITRRAVVARHVGQLWTVEFAGFAPGFGYLQGDGERLTVPRRSSPRTRVPAGAVALAGEYCGVYPADLPGGWQLIGRTDAPMWDVTRAEPALLTPGTTVRFEEVTG